MSETLLDIALSNFNYAKKNFKSLTGDERELNFIGYSIQQTVELALKHTLEICGLDYPKTHDITQLLNLITKNNIKVFNNEVFEDLDLYATTITSWETDSRYIKNFRVAIRRIEKGFELTEKVLDEIKKFSENKNIENDSNTEPINVEQIIEGSSKSVHEMNLQ